MSLEIFGKFRSLLGVVNIGYNSQDIKNSYADFDLIEKLGCRSFMIIPLKSGDNFM